jgi:PAS domain S-box-containing protein
MSIRIPSDSRRLSDQHLPGQDRIIGAGEMADLIRRFDWGMTSLGPIEGWSDTLVTTVNLILASRHPMFLWWGPELIQFYNDGYRPSIRADKHPAAIGQRGVECWPEIWSIIGPQIEAVMNQGQSTWNTNQLVPINREGRLEEVYWTYSYSPVRDKEGTVLGTLVVCSETTEHVLSERRLRTLLSIEVSDTAPDLAAEPCHLLKVAERLVSALQKNSADCPFVSLFLVNESEVLELGGLASCAALRQASHWPVMSVARSQTTLVVDDLGQRFGDLVLEPWPEPVTHAYVSPLALPGSTTQAVLVCGLSPRLPFDNSYRTFLGVVGDRIASLLQNEIHQLNLAKAAERFRRLADADPFGMVIGDLSGGLKYVNPGFLQTLGYSQNEVLLGKVRWDDLTPAQYAEADARALRQLLATGRCDVYEKVYIAKDGRHIPILLGASIISQPGEDPEVAAFVTDLTSLKVAEEALRRANDELEKKVTERTAALKSEVFDRERAETGLRVLTGRLLRSQDEERRRMARELHDNAGQILTALAMNLGALRAGVGEQDAKLVDLATTGEKLSHELSREIRTLSYLLHPPLLDEVGLDSALRWYVQGFSDRSGIQVELDLPEDFGRLSNELELVIFRVIQESLTNIHRHSGSTSAKIRLTRSPSAVEFEISDRGRGISPERLVQMQNAQAGVGVRGMQERLRQFGGTLRISCDGEGTRVYGALPI